MPFTIMTTIVEETELRNHLKETLEDLPNNLRQYDEPRLLGRRFKTPTATLTDSK
jgi:hypothetical protein